MNNWRLLLLAVVVVVQPIRSFSESNLINGRECCERSEDARLYGYRKADERRSLDGNREDHRTTIEDRRLRSLQEIREERRYETIRGPMLTRSEYLERSERRNSPELLQFKPTEQERRSSSARNRETRDDQNRNRDEFRNIQGQNKRDPSESRNRDTLDATRTIRVSRNTRDTRSFERESRNTMPRQQIRNSRSIDERRSSPNRDTTVLKREQEGITRRDSRLTGPARVHSRIQLDDNTERRVYSRRTQEEGSEITRSRFSDARINEVRAAQTLRTVEQSETHNRDSRDKRAELQRHQRNTELRDRVSAIRRESERTSAERMRESREENARLARDRMDIRNNERIEEHKQHRDENRRSVDTRRNTEERRLDSRQIRVSRSLDMTTSNDEQMERRSLSMLRAIRLSIPSERNTRNERATRIQVVRDESFTERRQDPVNNRILRDRTIESRRIASRMDISETSEEQRKQREVKFTKQSQESRRTATRRDVRESFEDQRQVNRLSKDRTISTIREVRNTERMRESSRTVRKSPEENRRLLMAKTISILRDVRDNTEQESRDESSELKQRANNRLSSNRISMLRADRNAHESVKRAQESRKASASVSSTEVNFDSRIRQEVQDRERSDLRRQVLQRTIKSPPVTRSMSVERRNYAHETFRASRSAESSRIRENTRLMERDERQQTYDQDRTIRQQVARKLVTPQRLDSRVSSRPESVRIERVVRNGDNDRTQSFQRATRIVATPQRSNSRRSYRPENIRLERLVRNRAEIRDTERRETQREERDDDRTRILTTRRINEKRSERGQNRQSSKDSRKVRMTRNQDAVRAERILAERRQDNRAAEDSRIVRGATRNLAEVRSDRVITEPRSVNRGSRNVLREIRIDDRLDSRLQHDNTRDSRETSLQRETRDAERLNVRARDSEALKESLNARGIRNNERQIQIQRTINTDAHRESKNVRANTYSTRERTESRIANGEREETRYRNMNSAAHDTLVQDSDKPVGDWQMIFYTLQGVYLCGLLMQMLTENANKSKKR